ncbi:hypothetical protein KY330_04975 [Candidatus Woesearchaeota archaeon]|nr:hypothetical protein [Candidatus Woesearchaeota archaeon]
MSRSSIGAMLAFLGFGGLILPQFGLQFRVLSLFGDPIVPAFIALALGILLVVSDI